LPRDFGREIDTLQKRVSVIEEKVYGESSSGLQRLATIEEQVRGLKWLAILVVTGILGNLALNYWSIKLLADVIHR